MLSACLIYQIQYIDNSWLHGMTDYNKTCQHAVVEFFDIGERSAVADMQTNDCCIC